MMSVCLVCKDIVDDNVNVKGIHPQSTPDDNVNDNVNDNINDNFNDNVDNIDSEDEDDIYLLTEIPPEVKPLASSRVSPLQIDVNGNLQSWLDDDNIIVNVIFPESFICVIAGPSECGKAFSLTNLFSSSIQFDRLYIIGPTCDQYEDLKYEDTVK